MVPCYAKSRRPPSHPGAAIIIEPILGEGGFVPAPAEFLHALRTVCDDTGILLVADEVQSGFGRTGTMWAHEPSGIIPDIMTLAKGIASGMPMSAIAAPAELMSKWQPGSHGGTYGGGSAIAMAAARATLEVISEERLTENAAQLGEYLSQKLRSIVSTLPGTTDVRGPGLMVGVEFQTDGRPDSQLTKRIQSACLQERLLLLTCGTNGNVLRWLPPLNVSKTEIDEALAIFKRAVEL